MSEILFKINGGSHQKLQQSTWIYLTVNNAFLEGLAFLFPLYTRLHSIEHWTQYRFELHINSICRVYYSFSFKTYASQQCGQQWVSHQKLQRSTWIYLTLHKCYFERASFPIRSSYQIVPNLISGCIELFSKFLKFKQTSIEFYMRNCDQVPGYIWKLMILFWLSLLSETFLKLFLLYLCFILIRQWLLWILQFFVFCSHLWYWNKCSWFLADDPVYLKEMRRISKFRYERFWRFTK